MPRIKYNKDGSLRKKLGRPKKATVEALKKGNRKSVGRPKGDAAVMNEFKARLLASPKTAKVMQTILAAAVDDNHKNQAAAWKLVMDRVAPIAGFEKEVVKAASGNQISITISGVPGGSANPGVSIEGKPPEPVEEPVQEIVEGEYVDVSPDVSPEEEQE